MTTGRAAVLCCGALLASAACLDVWSYPDEETQPLVDGPPAMTDGRAADAFVDPQPPGGPAVVPPTNDDPADSGAASLPTIVTRQCTIGGIEQGFDLQRDPNHCGACGNRCELPNAESYCASGACAIARCLPGFVDTDGEAINGCERGVCIRTPLAIGGTERIFYSGANEICSEGAGICRVENGELVFGFCLSSCTQSWDGCTVPGIDLAAFERPPEGAEDHLLQVEFCVEYGIISAPVNLWYGGDNAQKKWLPLVAPGQSLASGECYQRIFDRRQAKTADAPEALCGCSPADSLTACQLSRTDNLRVIAEWCAGYHSGQIRITSLQILTGSCGCASDGSVGCVEPTAQCRALDITECAAAGAAGGCIGASCAGYPEPGSTCTVSADGTYCAGRIVCADGTKSCVCDG